MKYFRNKYWGLLLAAASVTAKAAIVTATSSGQGALMYTTYATGPTKARALMASVGSGPVWDMLYSLKVTADTRDLKALDFGHTFSGNSIPFYRNPITIDFTLGDLSMSWSGTGYGVTVINNDTTTYLPNSDRRYVSGFITDSSYAYQIFAGIGVTGYDFVDSASQLGDEMVFDQQRLAALGPNVDIYTWFSVRFYENESKDTFSFKGTPSTITFNTVGSFETENHGDVPEPDILALFSLGLIGISQAGRRKA